MAVLTFECEHKSPRNFIKMQRPLLKVRHESTQFLHVPGDIMLLPHGLSFK